MDTTLNDAAFRLVSRSLASIDANLRAPQTDEERLSALRARFPDAEPGEIAAAHARAIRLEETAIAMADAFRGPGDGRHGPPLTRESLAERCPGFSDESYGWAVNDGFTETRK
jgi:hypothetical protein